MTRSRRIATGVFPSSRYDIFALHEQTISCDILARCTMPEFINRDCTFLRAENCAKMYNASSALSRKDEKREKVSRDSETRRRISVDIAAIGSSGKPLGDDKLKITFAVSGKVRERDPMLCPDRGTAWISSSRTAGHALFSALKTRFVK